MVLGDSMLSLMNWVMHFEIVFLDLVEATHFTHIIEFTNTIPIVKNSQFLHLVKKTWEQTFFCVLS